MALAEALTLDPSEGSNCRLCGRFLPTKCVSLKMSYYQPEFDWLVVNSDQWRHLVRIENLHLRDALPVSYRRPGKHDCHPVGGSPSSPVWFAEALPGKCQLDAP